MRKKKIPVILIGGLLLLPLVIVLTWGTVNATTQNLTQPEVERLAVFYAKQWGLQGEPTSIESKLISRDEYKARLDPVRSDVGSELWVIVLKGKVVVYLVHSPGNPPFQEYDNAYVELSMSGALLGTGSRSPGYELDLYGPVPPIPDRWPGPTENEPKDKSESSRN